MALLDLTSSLLHIKEAPVMYGELHPLGGGDPIPLLKRSLLVGRRESCDIVLRFANVSAHHCQLTLNQGYWYVKDMQSRNGVKVQGQRIGNLEKRLDPGDEIAVAKHRYEIRYSPMENGAVGPPPAEDLPNDILGKTLLERAGLERKRINTADDRPRRYDVYNNEAGQIKNPNTPM